MALFCKSSITHPTDLDSETVGAGGLEININIIVFYGYCSGEHVSRVPTSALSPHHSQQHNPSL